MDEATLKSIDGKLTAVIALLVRQLSGEGTKGIEAVLRSAGISTADIARLLNKSQRAIQLALKSQGYKE